MRDKSQSPRIEMEPLAVPAIEAARLCGVSVAMWWKMKNSARCPAPVRIGRRLLWRVDELRQWMAQGCPPASRFKADQYRRDAGRTWGELNNKTAG